MIIDFKKKPVNHGYNELLKAAVEKLSVMSSDLFDMAVKLALSGSWKEWSDSVPVGTELHVDDEMLLSSGDDTVRKITELSVMIDELAADIERKGR